MDPAAQIQATIPPRSVTGSPNPSQSPEKSSLNAIEPGDKLIGAAGGSVTLYVGLWGAVHRVEHHEAVLGSPILEGEDREIFYLGPQLPFPSGELGLPAPRPLDPGVQTPAPPTSDPGVQVPAPSSLRLRSPDSQLPSSLKLRSPKTHVSPEVRLGRRTTIIKYL